MAFKPGILAISARGWLKNGEGGPSGEGRNFPGVSRKIIQVEYPLKPIQSARPERDTRQTRNIKVGREESNIWNWRINFPKKYKFPDLELHIEKTARLILHKQNIPHSTNTKCKMGLKQDIFNKAKKSKGKNNTLPRKESRTRSGMGIYS
jgi:hypothetical protein